MTARGGTGLVRGVFWPAALAILAAAPLLAETAEAFDAQAFAPAVDRSAYFSVYSSRVVDAGRFHVALSWDYAKDPVSIGSEDTVTSLHTGHLLGAWAPLEDLEIGLDLPFSKVDSGASDVETSIGVDALRLLGRFRVLGDRGGPAGFALVPFVDLPTGDADRLTASDGTDFGLLAAADWTGERLRGALNLGYRVTPEGGAAADQILFGTAAGFVLLENDRVRRLELLAEVFGSTSQERPFEGEFATPVELLAGAAAMTPGGLFARLGAGRTITHSLNGPDLRVTLAVGYTPPAAPAAPPPPPRLPEAPPEPHAGFVVTDEAIVPLAPALFPFDSARLQPQAEAILDEVAVFLRNNPGIRLRVEGHTDSVGREDYNEILSRRRAGAVTAYLVEKGIEPSRLENVGFGEVRPVATNLTMTGRARNRRTELHVLR